MKLRDYKKKNGYTYADLAHRFGTSIDKVFRWLQKGADVKRINGKRCIVLTEVMATEEKK